MLRLEQMSSVGRLVRQDDVQTLGTPTSELAVRALRENESQSAQQLITYSVDEGKALHNLFCDWVWNLLSEVADRFGEAQMYLVLRASQQGWMMKRTWKGFLKLTVLERVQLTAEIMRSHLGGPAQRGEITVTEDDEKYSILMDPCGSGGRMRRGDPVERTPSRLGPPYNFGRTKDAHVWSWGQKDVPYYCLHCCLNEMLPMEWGGHPLWVTGYDPDESKPCAWHFYKRADLIPEHYYQRVGRTKPTDGSY